MNVISTGLLVFGFALASEILWVAWARAIDAKRHNLVASSSTSIAAVSYLSMYLVIDNLVMIFPALAGSLVGAYVGMSIPIKFRNLNKDAQQ